MWFIPEPLAKIMLDLTWAAIETVDDMNRLANGEGVGLFKAKIGDDFDSWRSSLKSMFVTMCPTTRDSVACIMMRQVRILI